MAPTLNQVLGLDAARSPEAERYEVLGVLGSGDYGQVLLGRDRKLSREVAIKVLITGQLDVAVAGRFYREAKALAALQHPAILQVLDFSGSDFPKPFLVSERLVGCDLQTVIDQGALDEIEVVAIAHEVAGALATAHAAGLIHRDVKPANIFVQPNGRVVLIDFGFVSGVREDNTRLTFVAKQTSILGTPNFASPEQCGGPAPMSPASDLFSLGSTLYYAATQVQPFRGQTVLDIFAATLQQEPYALNELIDCSKDFEQLVHHLLKKKPSERPASADAVARRCATLLSAKNATSASVIAAMYKARGLPTKIKVSKLDTLRLEAPEPAQIEQTIRARAEEGETRFLQLREARRAEPSATLRMSATPAVSQRREAKAHPPWAIVGVLAVVTGVTVSWAMSRLHTLAPPIPSNVIVPLSASSPPTPSSVQVPTPSIVAIEPPPLPPEPDVVVAPSAPDTPVSPTPKPVVKRAAVTDVVAPVSKGPATLHLVTKPWANIVLDGRPVGATPVFRSTELAAGRHTLRFEHPGFAPVDQTIDLKAGEQRDLTIELHRQ